MLKITPASEKIKVNNIKILIYGQPGVYKTSTAFTAESPLLLDFDEGAYRSEFRKDTVQISSWQNIESMTEKDLEPYKTLCVDTVGRLLDLLSIRLIEENPKLAQRVSGALTLQGYGELKAEYAAWLKRIIGYGKDVVLVSHEKEDKKRDDLIVRPDIQGGSYGEVFKRADSVGYMYRGNKGVVLDFSPSDTWVGKNVAQFQPFEVPNFHQEPSFLAGIISDIKQAMGNISEEGARISAVIDEWREKINGVDGEKQINEAITEATNIKDRPIQIQVKHLIKQRADDLELVWEGEKGKGKYVKAVA